MMFGRRGRSKKEETEREREEQPRGRESVKKSGECRYSEEKRKKRNRPEDLRTEMVFCHERKADGIEVRAKERKRVEEDIQVEGRREGKDVKEDREEQGSWEEKGANSIEQ